MRWTAEHVDGFTTRLLSYTLVFDSGVAELKADWFLPEPPTRNFRKQFVLDDTPLKKALPVLQSMQELYVAPWTDMDTKMLIIESGDWMICRHVYGAGVLVFDHPELQPFIDLFAWLESQVIRNLPWLPGTAP